MKDFIELRIKIKSLAEETRIIHQQEIKIGQFIRKGRKRVREKHGDPVEIARWENEHQKQRKSLSDHRRLVVSHEVRHSLLAYGFLRGRPMERIERSKKPVDWKKVQDMIVRFSGMTDSAEIAITALKLMEWRNAATCVVVS